MRLRHSVLLALLLLLPSTAYAQIGAGPVLGRPVSSLPATCTVRDLVFLTTAPIGLHECRTTNTWTRVAAETDVSATYVPLTRTVNGQALSSNITLAAANIGGGGVAQWTNDASYTTLALVDAQKLSVFAATTSAELAAVLSDEAGSGGGFVRATSPTITTPTIAKLANLTGNGFVKTSGSDGTLSVDTSAYITGVAWGAITGTLSNQTDLQTAFNAKAALAGATFTGNVLFSADNTLDIGASLATRPRDLFLGRNAVMGGGLTIGASASVTVASGSLNLYSASGQAVYFGIGNVFGGSMRLDAATFGAMKGLRIASDLAFGWSSDTSSYGTSDVARWRDGVGIESQRGGSSAQTERLEATFTDASNRLYSQHAASATAIEWSAVGIGTSSGANVDLTLTPKGTGRFRYNIALVALGAGAAPTLGTVGGSGPATAAQSSWLEMKDSTGASIWIPVWK